MIHWVRKANLLPKSLNSGGPRPSWVGETSPLHLHRKVPKHTLSELSLAPLSPGSTSAAPPRTCSSRAGRGQGGCLCSIAHCAEIISSPECKQHSQGESILWVVACQVSCPCLGTIILALSTFYRYVPSAFHAFPLGSSLCLTLVQLVGVGVHRARILEVRIPPFS